jgi:hypothetical protein
VGVQGASTSTPVLASGPTMPMVATCVKVPGAASIEFRMVPHDFPNALASFSFGNGNYTPNEVLYICGTCSSGTLIPLAANFGDLNAEVKNGKLDVDWTTLSEKNVNFFLVQVSDDGKTFHTISKIATKAEKDISNVAINYTLLIDTENVAFSIAVIFCVAGLGFIRKETVKKVSILSMLFILTVFATGCIKKENVSVVSGGKDIYVRVVEVDKDGANTYSKIVKTIRK